MRVEDVRSALYLGTVRHVRHAVRRHAFAYGIHHLLLNLDELPELDRRLRGFGHNRPALTSFRDSDHLGRGHRPVRDKLGQWLSRQGLALPGGPVLLLTSPRVLGYVFNPVSFYYCLDRDHDLRLVVAEVNNTFGETHLYLLEGLSSGPGGTVTAAVAKVFHVSPFFRVEGDYRFALSVPGETLRVAIDYRRGGEPQLVATLEERRRELDGATLAGALLRHPHVTARTVALIHWQALRLWLKRVPWYPKPAPPPAAFEDRP